MCYVILSRITCLSQLYLLDFDPKKIYCNENAKREAKSINERALNKKTTEWDLTKENTIKLTTLNVRSLQKHYEDLIADDYILRHCVPRTSAGRVQDGSGGWYRASPSARFAEVDYSNDFFGNFQYAATASTTTSVAREDHCQVWRWRVTLTGG